MRHPARLTLLSQCILLSLTAISGSAFAKATDSGVNTLTSESGFQTTTSDGANGAEVLYVNNNGAAMLSDGGTDHKDIYMWDHNTEDTQSLTVNSTDMSGAFIQAGYGGTKNITMNDATTDMIEGGGIDATNINITLDNSTLNGEGNNANENTNDYGTESGNSNSTDKTYMRGAAIFIDSSTSAGTNNIAIENNSQINGAIYAVTAEGDNNINATSGSNIAGTIYAMSASGNNNISLNDTTVSGEDNTTLLGYFESSFASSNNSDALQDDLDGSTLAIGTYGTQSSAIALNNTTVTGDIAMVGDSTATDVGTSTASLSLNGSTTVTGDVILADHSTAVVSMNDSTISGNIDATDEGDTTITLNNSTVDGNITTGDGDDVVTLANDSHVNGDVNGNGGSNTLSLDEGSSITGSIANFDTVDTAGNNDIETDTIADNSTWNVNGGSSLTVDNSTGNDVQVNMSSDSQVNLGTIADDANDDLVVTSTALNTANQQNVEIASFDTTSDNPSDAVSATFSNGAQQVESRSGAYNYEDTLSEQQVTTTADGLTDSSPTSNTYNLYFSSSRRELASDVQGVIAGLDAAKQAGRMITDDLANRLNQVHLQNLYGHGVDGAQVWGDFLYQNGDYSDDVDYKDITQGVQGGVDWTSHLTNGDSLTGGIALGWTRSRDRNNTGGSNNFNDSVYGNYYSLYGGWQQSLHNNLWGMFVDGSFSYGDMRYSTSANNVSNATTGMTQALNGSSDGSLYTTQARTGVNVLLPGDTVLQPYATVGWDKAQENGFSDQDITFGDSQVSEWNTGFGMRITTKLADLNKNVALYPWLDARYQTEFSDNTNIKAADYHNTDGHNAKMGIFGAGINTTIGNDFSLNTGVYFGTGDVDNDASVQAGMSYHF
ncbi:autotransporter outer membrane beta-barrel domain-containing protein [Kluyvera sichuanensis]